jgi:hypothetical protein
MNREKVTRGILGLVIIACFICLLLKSFVAVYYYKDDPTVMITLKTNPFSTNKDYKISSDDFYKDIHSPLLLQASENKTTGEDFLLFVFKIPLVVYFVLFIALITVYRIVTKKIKTE